MENVRDFLYNHRGILYIVISGLGYGCLGILVQLLSSVHILESSSVRALFLVLMPLIDVCVSRVKPTCSIKQFFWIMANGCACTAVQTTLFIAYGLAPAGDVIAIVYSSPLLSGILARIFLKEKLAYYDVILSLLSMIGVFFISKPVFIFGSSTADSLQQDVHFIGTMWAVGALFLYSIPTVISRKLRLKSASASVMTLTFGLLALFTNATLNTVTGQWSVPKDMVELMFLIAIGVSGFIGIQFYHLSLKTEKAIFATLGLTLLTILITYILQFIIFRIYPDIFTGIGIIFICGATIGAFTVKWLTSKETNEERIEDKNTKEKDTTNQTDHPLISPDMPVSEV
ncbi:Solute carrier family 35 member G1 [Holothuria leucospilota]|uniref:Solute carrier family 35 member G1 n=1 Tax=Holothuria leucospilota TaxID=206669 RepID=A0A9Q0YQG6_HOLLE|nr:Solute carrier family 35 member G1 [Holothuria leucospilota]